MVNYELKTKSSWEAFHEVLNTQNRLILSEIGRSNVHACSDLLDPLLLDAAEAMQILVLCGKYNVRSSSTKTEGKKKHFLPQLHAGHTDR